MKSILSFTFIFITFYQFPLSAKGKDEGVRLKDLMSVAGLRSNQLIGYGIVAGLPGTGDTKNKLASESMQNLLSSLGQKAESLSQARNIAAVVVTADVPPFMKKGDRIDITVSSIGDARSLEGGVLLQTPMTAADGKIYLVGQGAITTGGKSEEHKIQGRNVGRVMNGGIVEREATSKFEGEERTVRLVFREFDFGTLHDAAEKIRSTFPDAPTKLEGGSLLVQVPAGKEPLAFLASLEEIRIVPRPRARVVINERSGTIVMGGDLRIDPVLVSRGGMELTIKQPRPEVMGIHVPAEKQKEDKPKSSHVLQAASVSEVVEALNSMGAGIRDIIAILEALEESGALHAEVIVQ